MVAQIILLEMNAENVNLVNLQIPLIKITIQVKKKVEKLVQMRVTGFVVIQIAIELIMPLEINVFHAKKINQKIPNYVKRKNQDQDQEIIAEIIIVGVIIIIIIKVNPEKNL